MDSDLDTMSREQLLAEVRRLRDGIRKHRDSTEHELCWHHPQLWGLLPEKSDPLSDGAGVASIHDGLYSVSCVLGRPNSETRLVHQSRIVTSVWRVL
jgi:hypothetical protein